MPLPLPMTNKRNLKITNKQTAHYSDFPFQSNDATQVLGNLLIVNGARSYSRPVIEKNLKKPQPSWPMWLSG